MTCKFCGKDCGEGRLVPFRGALEVGCAPQCPAAYVAQAVAHEVLVMGLPCARRWPIDAHVAVRVLADQVPGALATLERMGVIVRDGDEETTWGWRLAEVAS